MKNTGRLQRALSIVMALAMLLALVPSMVFAADNTTVYLKPNANWLSDGARFAVYYWTADANGWADMTDTDDEGYYEGSVPGDAVGIIFCRMDPNNATNDWSAKWNQTGDLTLPTDGNHCYAVAEDTWDQGGGEWVTYPIEEETQPSESETTEPAAATYIVAGDSALCGVNWDASAAANQMTLNTATGLYEKVYSNVAAGTYSIKVTDGTWTNSWGEGSSNYTFTVSAACDVTITFDESAKTVKALGDGVGTITELEIGVLRTVGNGSGLWLNGASWDVAAAANSMTANGSVYEITYKNIPQGTGYQVKFAADGAWTHNWGGTFAESGKETEAVYNSSANITFDVACEAADVTLKLDLTNFNYADKSGATFTVTITEAQPDPALDYYLVGYINGADHGCEGDYANLGDYKFVDGKLTATFTADSYVFVKTGDNANWYMAQSYCTDKTVTLENTTVGTSEKLYVPGGVELTFTLTANADDTLTLSYASAGDENPDTPEIPEGYTAVTIHFLKTEGWGTNVNAYLWTDLGAVPGYEAYNTWPGKSVSANATHAGWYDVMVATEEPTAFSFIFNDGGNQTGDLNTGAITGDTELWVIGNTVYTTAPGEWNGIYTYDVIINFHNTADWQTVNAKLGQGDSWDAISGYEAYKNNEFGSAVAANTANPDWYTVSLQVVGNDAAINGLFNNGAWGDGNQTGNWTTGTLEPGKNEFWYDNGTLSDTAPDGWADSSLKVYVPGTFPGPSWDAASNQMTYDPALGLYVYTFQAVPAAGYEFKIAINGTWDENYGAGGKFEGSNIAVTVPETMDVTVYYNAQTHYAVTNVTYVFADITLSGTGIPEGVKLTDKGLTGIYSVTVDMKAGTYTDVMLTYDGKAYKFDKVEVDADKPVTFYMDPVTGLYYNNASGEPILPGSVYYNSQDSEYKSVFGALATGEACTFSIDTLDTITSAVLVIGAKSFPMTAEETGDGLRWSCEASVNTIGEHTYYFAVSNGSAVAVYGDDDGYYGEGTLCELTDVKPYDLVVYQAGYETPDWMKNAVIYQIFPDRFFDGDETNNQAQTTARGDVDYEYISNWYTWPENPEQEQMNPGAYPSNAHKGDGQWSNEIYGGDLEGITERIGYLKALGVNVIYLNPVFSSISSHRYDACDYMEIDPILGTMGDFEELVAVATANDMHIILDGVFNHVSDDSVYFDRYYKFLGTSEKIGAYPYWAYVYDYMAEAGVDQAAAEAAAKAYFSEHYGITDYSYTQWFQVNSTPMAGAVDDIGLRAGKPVYSYQGWWGYDSMPVIFSTNGSEYQTGNWAQEIIYNPDGTSATQFWLSKGSDGWRLDVANEVSDETWINFRSSVKAMGSGNVIIGEIWDDATHYLLGNMYDSVMNYMFRNAVTAYAMGAGAESTTKAMEKLRERYPEEAFYAMMNLVGSHDTSRILSYLDGIGDDRTDKTPAGAYPTYETTSTLAKNRQYLVAFMQFTYAGAPTVYYGDELGMVGSDDPDDRRAMEWGKGNQELVTWYATLAAIREAYPALRTGSVEAFTADANVLGYVRRNDGDALIVVANNAGSAKTVTLDLAELNVTGESLTDLITGKVYTAAEGKVTVTVDSLRGAILTANPKEITVNTAGLAPAYDAAYTVAGRSENAPTVGYSTQDGTVTIGDSLSFTVDALVNTFVGVKVNGETLTDADYEVKEGTVVTLTAAYIEKLGVSEDNAIEILFEGGSAQAKFTVQAKEEEPSTDPSEEPSTQPSESETTEPSEEESTAATTKPGTGDNSQTGDNSNVHLWIGVLGVSAVALLVLLILALKNKKKG